MCAVQHRPTTASGLPASSRLQPVTGVINSPSDAPSRWAKPRPATGNQASRLAVALGPADAAARACWASSPASDRKSTRLNSSHVAISYAVFCLKKKIEKRSGISEEEVFYNI